ncbi:hypothetical protein Tco_0044159, partial [Tanacetum coccineum]
VYVIEFQKRGLPHAHILLWLEEHSKCKTPGEVDDIISAEMPSPTANPDGYKVVTHYMLHGSCGKDARNAACTSDGKCSKHFPKPFLAETFLDEDGYPHYRRRDNKATFKNGNFIYDNKHVGPNRATIVNQRKHKKWNDYGNRKCSGSGRDKKLPEHQVLPNARHLVDFSFDIHYTYPSVMQLSFHLPNQNAITLRDLKRLPALLQRDGIDVTMFTDWFELNKVNCRKKEIEKMHRQDCLLKPDFRGALLS